MSKLFFFLNILILGLCNFWSKYLFDIFLFLIPLPEVFLSKKLQTTEVRALWYSLYLGYLAISNAIIYQHPIF